MTRFPVICRIDQKEKQNERTQSNGSLMGKKLGGWHVGRVHDRQYQSKRFGHGFAGWRSAIGNAMGQSERCKFRQQEVSVGEWMAVGGFVIAILTAIYSSMRIIIRSVMSELSPNSGSSMKDQISRIEARLDYLYTQLIEQKK